MRLYHSFINGPNSYSILLVPVLHEIGDADGGRPADAGDAVHQALDLVLVRLVNQLGRFLCEEATATLVNIIYSKL